MATIVYNPTNELLNFTRHDGVGAAKSAIQPGETIEIADEEVSDPSGKLVVRIVNDPREEVYYE
jgi:hypothetical protein